MKQSLFTLEHTRQLTDDTYELVLSGDTSAITAPGQCVNIQLPGKFLRRPISICNWTDRAGTVCQHPAARPLPPPPHFHLQLDRSGIDAAGQGGGRRHPGAGALRPRHGAGRAQRPGQRL